MKITYRPAMTAVLGLSMSLASAGSTVCSLPLPASPTELKNMNFAQLFREANTLMEEGLWHQAARTWEEALKKEPGNRNARFRRAICLFEMGENLWNVQGELERSLDGNVARRYDPFNETNDLPPVEAWLWLATVEHRLMDFDQARIHIATFAEAAGDKHVSTDLASKLIAEIQFAQTQLDNPRDITVTNMTVNSEADESHPVLTADGETLFFSSNRLREDGSNAKRLDPNTQAHYQDIYQTQRIDGATWSAPKRLDVGIDHHAQVVSVDAFGTSLVIEEHDGWNAELRQSHATADGWSKAESMVLDKRMPQHGEVVFFPSKDRILASVVDRKGEGGFDLYESERRGDGSWTPLKPLGNTLNTWGDEITPFVAADGQTVFFSSNGHVGMGGYDVYRTVRDAEGTYANPVNMGAPINSVDDDLAFVVAADGKVGYFASRRDVKRGDLDLYRADIHEEDVVNRDVVVVSLGTEQGANSPEHLVLRNAETQREVGRYGVIPGREVFQMILEAGTSYVVEAEATNANGDVELVNVRTVEVPAEGGSGVVNMPLSDLFSSDLMASTGHADAPFVLDVKRLQPETVATPSATVAALVNASEAGEGMAAYAGEAPASDASPDMDEAPEVPEEVMEAFDMFVSSPICEMVLSSDNGYRTLVAVQLYAGQVHSRRLNLEPAVHAIATAAQSRKPSVRIEGSASDVLRRNGKSNQELANERAIDVYLRLVADLQAVGMAKGEDYDIEVVRRVQPDADTPASLRNENVNVATFQYVRIDMN